MKCTITVYLVVVNLDNSAMGFFNNLSVDGVSPTHTHADNKAYSILFYSMRKQINAEI